MASTTEVAASHAAHRDPIAHDRAEGRADERRRKPPDVDPRSRRQFDQRAAVRDDTSRLAIFVTKGGESRVEEVVEAQLKKPGANP